MSLKRLANLTDIHVHLREPGATHKEDFKTGSQAALAGGITTLVDMPNNPLPTTSIKALKNKVKLAKAKSLVDLFFYFGANNRNWGTYEKLAKHSLWARVKGLKIYLDHTTGPLLIEDLAILQKHFKSWPPVKPILIHGEGATILKAVQLAAIYKQRLHLCHLSQASELEIVAWAKKKGLAVTAEVTPHHLFLNQTDLGRLGSLAMMRPPLRRAKDNQALWQALRQGLIDCLASDHAPHTLKEKKRSLPPNGVPGLETMLPLMLTAVVQKRISLKRLTEALSFFPACFLGIKKDVKTFCEVDLDRRWVIKNENLKTKCGWSPFHGQKVIGKVVRVFYRGQKVYEEGK